MRVVVPAADRARVPGRVPVPLPRPPRLPDRRQLAGVAHGGRRVTLVRRARGQGAHRDRARRPGAQCAPDERPASRSRDDARRRPPLRPRRGRDPRRPGARPAREARPKPNVPCSARSDTPRTTPCCTPTPRCSLAAPRARSSWNYLLDRCDGGADGVQVSYDMNRLQRIDEPVDYVVTLNADARIDDDSVLAADGLHAPGVHAGVGRRAAPSARAQRRARRLRRRVPRLGLPRRRLPVGSPRPPRASGCDGDARSPAALYRTRIVARARARAGSCPRLLVPAPDVVGRSRRRAPAPPRGLRPLLRFDARDHLGDPTRAIRANVDAFLAGHGIAAPHARPDARQPALVRPRFNPLTVYWCYDARRRPLRGVIAEVHNTYGERHCYLLRPDAGGRAEHRQGALRLAVLPRRRPVRDAVHGAGRPSSISEITLRRGDRAVFRASLAGRARARRGALGCRSRAAAPARRAGGSSRGSGSRGSASGCAVCPSSPARPHVRAGGRVDGDRGRASASSDRDYRPRARGGRSPPAPRKRVHAAICRALFMRIARGLPVRVELPDGSVTAVADGDDPVMRIHRDAFFHRVGSDGLIGFGESYMAGDWDADDLGAALAAVRRPGRVARAGVDAAAAPRLRAPAAAERGEHPARRARRTSSVTTTCRTTCSRCSSTSR